MLAAAQMPSGFCISGAIKGRLASGGVGGRQRTGGWSLKKAMSLPFRGAAVLHSVTMVALSLLRVLRHDGCKGSSAIRTGFAG